MQRPSIMVIEDDSDLGTSVIEVLSFLDLEAELVTDGIEAAARIAASKPDILLLDVHLPGKSGLDILAEIRANPALARMFVVLMTADVFISDEERRNADYILIKPYSITELGDLVVRISAERGNN